MESSTCQKESFSTKKVSKRESWPKEYATSSANSCNG